MRSTTSFLKLAAMFIVKPHNRDGSATSLCGPIVRRGARYRGLRLTGVLSYESCRLAMAILPGLAHWPGSDYSAGVLNRLHYTFRDSDHYAISADQGLLLSYRTYLIADLIQRIFGAGPVIGQRLPLA